MHISPNQAFSFVDVLLLLLFSPAVGLMFILWPLPPSVHQLQSWRFALPSLKRNFRQLHIRHLTLLHGHPRARPILYLLALHPDRSSSKQNCFQTMFTGAPGVITLILRLVSSSLHCTALHATHHILSKYLRHYNNVGATVSIVLLCLGDCQHLVASSVRIRVTFTDQYDLPTAGYL